MPEADEGLKQWGSCDMMGFPCKFPCSPETERPAVTAVYLHTACLSCAETRTKAHACLRLHTEGLLLQAVRL